MKKQCFSLILAALLPMSINVLTSCTSKTKEKEKEKEEEEEKFEPKVYDLPCFYVNTENKAPITSKEEYVKCTTTINNTKSEYKLFNSSGKIRGRGNSTWKQEKKPYKLKFDESTDLFGNGSAKTWTLIANHFNPTLIKNYLAYSVCNEFASQPYTTSLEFVDLYLNNEYQGVYAVCEQIEAHKNRVNIIYKNFMNINLKLFLLFFASLFDK